MAHYKPHEINSISQEPGIYIFHDSYGKIIYIGKAINLRSRVRSYWNESNWKDRPKLKFLIPKITQIETIITKSEKEALILESSLVFKHQPRYNSLLKANNKNFPWLVITYDEAYPRLIPVRNVEAYQSKNKNTRNKFFGPYTNISAMYENLNLVHELFPLRRKKIPPFKDRPCLNYDMGLCLGPCQKLVSESDYALMLDQVEMLLKGNFQDLKALLESEMYEHSDNLDYEKAAKARDRIKALETFNEVQNVISEDSNLEQDIFVLVLGEDLACLQIFKTREGRLINRDTIEIDPQEDSELEIFESAFLQYYARLPESEIPKEILINYDLKERVNLYEDWLSERRGNKVKILKPERGDKLAQIKLACRNGKIILEKLKLEQMEEASRDINQALMNLRERLGMRSDPHRMECYDISHIQGHSTVASMVCFIDGLPAKEEYRKFKISKDQNNDFDSMREVITRRFKGIADDYDGLPDLIIIDGGKGQLNAAREVLENYGLTHIKLVSLAKREEEIFEPNNDKPIILDRRSPELFLIQRIRNEAHRFAITYHRKLRSKKSLESVFDGIPGLGPKKRKLLIDKFKSIDKIKAASNDELAALSGFSANLVERIKSILG